MRTHTTPPRGLLARPLLPINLNQVFHLEEDSIADQSGLSLATSTLNDSQIALSDVTLAVQPDGPTHSAFSFDSP